MAKQVSEILIKLGLQGVEGLDKLKGAFRELEKSIGPNNAAIERARQSIIDYGRDSRNTEQVIKGQIDALRGLQSQVERGSSTWAQLATDIEQFRQASRRTDSELETLRQGILAISSGTNQSQASLRAYIADLGKLRSEASLTGRTFTDLGQDIAQLTGRLQQAEAQTVQTSRAFGRVLGQALASTSAGARRQLQDLQLLIAEQRQAIDTIDTLSQRERRLTHNVEARADAQDRLNRSLAQQRQLTYQESIRAGRETVRAGAAAFADPNFLSPEGVNRRFGELPNTTAALSQELSELSERYANTTRSSVDYLTVATQIAGMQRELTQVTQGYAQALLMGIRTGTVAPSARNLREVVTALRAEMDQLDVTTTEGARAYADNAREANALERRIRSLAGAYRSVGEAARSAATNQQGVNPYLPSGGRNPSFVPALSPAMETTYPQPIGPLPFPEAGRRAQRDIESALGEVNRIYENSKVQRAEIQAKYDQIFLDKVEQGLDMESRLVMEASDKQFKRELDKFDEKMDIADRKRRSRLTAGQAVQAAGAAISGGIFGGPEGFLGGIGGAAIGSAIPGLGVVGGSFAGAAIGAQVGIFRQQIAGTADYAAQIGKLQIALRGIVGSQQDYETALRVAAGATRELNIPQEEAIGGLTRLTAAVKGAGGTVMDSSFAFRAINEAVKATGGNAEKADGAVLALTQVFSKGKVSAEELNQIAERLPGTFTLFAQAAGKTGPELQKALEQGQVGLNDLMKFLAILRDRYSGTARDIAKSSEDAGARLRVAFDGMRLSVGKALQPLGAEFQNAFANFITNITPALTAAAAGVASAISNMYRIIASGFGLLGQLRDLIVNVTKVLIVFGGVSAGVFVANNITTFTTAIKGVLVALRTMLSIEKALLVIESARLATQALIAGVATGANKGRVVGAVLGGAAGIGAVVGIGELIKKIVKDVESGISGGLGNVKLDFKDLSTNFPSPPDKSADKAAKAQESLMRKLQSDFDGTITQLGRQFNAVAKDKLYETLLDYEARIQKAYKQNNLVLAEDLKLKQKAAALDITEEVLLSEKASLQQKLTEARAKGLDTQAVQNRLDTVNAELKQINYDSTKETTAQLEKQATLATQIKDALTQAFAPTTGGPRGLLTSGVVGGVFPGAFTGEEESFKSLTDQRGIERIKELGKELQALTNPLSQILTAAEAIGSAFSSSFTSVISGTASTQEALASFFNNIANYFLDMAGKIIAKWIEMAILNTVLQLLPSGPKFGSSAAVPGLPGLTGAGALSGGTSIAGTTDWASQGGGLFSKFKMNALGNAYAANGIVPFAMGGIVNKPTLFRFANGGVPGTGLMGEAGPEAIIPLKRGPDGKLGVSGGGGVSVGEINITVQNSGETLSPAAQKQIANQVQGIVLTTLVNQKRSGGIL
jgi:tape measure domain-containing protein